LIVKEGLALDTKEAKAAKREEKQDEKRQRQYNKAMEGGNFKKWRNQRPRWGATLTLLAGSLILYIPLQLHAIALIPGSLVFIGFLFAGLTLIIGTLAYIYPQFSTVFGVITIFLSVLSIMGALGGFIVGTILGIVGGAFLIAWSQEEVFIKNDKQQNKSASNKSSKPKNQEKTASTV